MAGIGRIIPARAAAVRQKSARSALNDKGPWIFRNSHGGFAEKVAPRVVNADVAQKFGFRCRFHGLAHGTNIDFPARLYHRFQAHAGVGQWMVSRGLAVAYTRYSYEYQRAECQAKSAKLGMWAGEF